MANFRHMLVPTDNILVYYLNNKKYYAEFWGIHLLEIVNLPLYSHIRNKCLQFSLTVLALLFIVEIAIEDNRRSSNNFVFIL